MNDNGMVLPALDVEQSAAFYRSVFGWRTDVADASFEGPGVSGRWALDRSPADSGATVLWVSADRLWPTLNRVVSNGGVVRSRPRLVDGERWLTEIDDPAGNRLGIVVPTGQVQSQTLIVVRDVEASSRWYQQLLGLQSDHGGPDYERLLAGGVLVLQLHHREVGHHHGVIGRPDAAVGNGVLLWFGEVTDFDAVVARAEQLQAPVVRALHRNPPEGNGPSHREIWIEDPDGYTVVVASPDGEAFDPEPS